MLCITASVPLRDLVALFIASVPRGDPVLLCAIASVPLRVLFALFVTSVPKGESVILRVIGIVEVSKFGVVWLGIVKLGSALVG